MYVEIIADIKLHTRFHLAARVDFFTCASALSKNIFSSLLKLSPWGLRHLHNVYINMRIAVILTPSLNL